MKTLQIRDLKCDIAEGGDKTRILYLIYPEIEGVSDSFMSRIVKKWDVTVAAVYVPADQWNNYLTPWPEPPEEKGFDPFGGKAEEFFNILKDEIIPSVEKEASISEGARRDLIGVSLSGLFALWQWLQHDIFQSLSVLSGSFWYKGFMAWFDALQLPRKTGSAFFLLGLKEPKAKIAAYRSVGVNTEAVVARLKEAGIATTFEWVPGNHFSDPIHRLETGAEFLLKS